MSTVMIVAFFVVGIVLMSLEFFVIPGFGVSGVLGIAALVTGIIFATHSVLEGVLITGGTLVVLGLLIYISFRSPETNPLWKKLALHAKQNRQEGYVAPKVEYKQYLGQTGIALTPLRPAGTGEFCGRRVDVVTEGEFITRGSKIEVLEVEGTRIVVREQRDNLGSC